MQTIGYNPRLLPKLQARGLNPPSIPYNYPFQAHASGNYASDVINLGNQEGIEKQAYGLTSALVKVVAGTAVVAFLAYKFLN